MTRIPFTRWPRPRGTGRRRSTSWLAAGLWLSLIAVPAALDAESLVQTGLEGIGEKVSDSELAGMRGKFITSDSVAYFGVQMTTSWQGQDGITTVANLMFTLNFTSGQPSPQILVGWTRQGDPAMDVASTSGAAPDKSAFATSAGAVQSTVIAGSDNRALNSMTIAIAPLLAMDQTVPAGLKPANGSQTETFANGDTLRFIVDSTGLGLAFGNGPNAASQMVSSDAGHAMQAISLMNNNNNVFNNMSMVVGLAPGQMPAQIQAQQAILSHLTMGF